MQRSFVLLLVAISSLSLTKVRADETMSPDVARELGLVQVWTRPIHAPFGAQSIMDQQLFVHSGEQIEYVEIVKKSIKPASTDSEASPSGKVLTRLRTDKVDRSGKPMGLDEAKRIASNEIRKLKRRGIEAEINVRNVPRVRLYSVASDGRVESRDAETGEIVWSVRVGDRRLPYLGLGVSEKFITVINGSNLIQLGAAKGETIIEVPTMKAPLFGAINSGRFAMIPSIGGGVQGYPLYDPTIDPFLEIVEGSALHLPTKAPGTTKIAWGTNRGFVYVMEMQGTPSVLFRLNTDGIVSGRVASAPGDRFFFGSENGQVYGIRATRSGVVLWSQPYGEPFYNEPYVVDDKILLRSAYGNLYALDAKDGSMLWEQATPNVADLMGAFGSKVYVKTLSGSLAVVDLETGAVAGIYRGVRPDRLLTNRLTDRLYLVSTNGHVQCLRPENADLPTFNIQPEKVTEPEEKKEADPPAGTPFDADNSNPFGADPGADNPFGGGDAMDDPFGGGDAMDDPFGGGDDAMDDPFGGDNPFGS